MIHGADRYRKGCRCEDCRAGHAAQMRLYRAAKTRRAMHEANRWRDLLVAKTLPEITLAQVHRITGISCAELSRIRSGKKQRLQGRTVDALRRWEDA